MHLINSVCCSQNLNTIVPLSRTANLAMIDSEDHLWIWCAGDYAAVCDRGSSARRLIQPAEYTRVARQILLFTFALQGIANCSRYSIAQQIWPCSNWKLIFGHSMQRRKLNCILVDSSLERTMPHTYLLNKKDEKMIMNRRRRWRRWWHQNEKGQNATIPMTGNCGALP